MYLASPLETDLSFCPLLILIGTASSGGLYLFIFSFSFSYFLCCKKILRSKRKKGFWKREGITGKDSSGEGSGYVKPLGREAEVKGEIILGRKGCGG